MAAVTAGSPEKFAGEFIAKLNMFSDFMPVEEDFLEVTRDVLASWLAEAYRQGGLAVLKDIQEVLPEPVPPPPFSIHLVSTAAQQS